MRPASRELWIISGVLVPFGVLVVLGLAWPRAPDGVRVESSPPPVRLERQDEPRAQARTGEPAPEARLAPPVPAQYPAELDTPLRAVEAEVRRCLVDQGTRAPRQVDVEVAFRPTISGAFEAVVVRPQWQDPYLEACVEDVFAEVHWALSGRETFAPASFTFHLSR